MSTATAELRADGVVDVRLELDLLRSAGSREAYYELSQVEDPLNDSRVKSVLAPLPEAVILRLGNQPIPLQVTNVTFTDASREAYLDPFQWPRTVVVLHGELSQATDETPETELRAQFGEGFRFEEPIATTIIYAATGTSQTRWLVTNQHSPAFDASAWVGANPSMTKDEGFDFASLASFLWAGFKHIIPLGIDHLLFVAALFLGARSVRNLIWIISAFTLAHSLTLAASTLGWVDVPALPVEIAVLLSIAWVGSTNLVMRKHINPSLVVVLLFGLMHGLGFANALAGLPLPSEQRLLALVAFNLGVELGQLVFIALLAAFFVLRRRAVSPAGQRSAVPVSGTERRIGSVLILAGVAIFLTILIRTVAFP